jgi:predicted RNase H-like HicB family nuclease
VTLQIVVHEEPTGGYWAEVPALPGCATQADTIPDLMERVREAIEGWLQVDAEDLPKGQVFEIAV